MAKWLMFKTPSLLLIIASFVLIVSEIREFMSYFLFKGCDAYKAQDDESDGFQWALLSGLQ